MDFGTRYGGASGYNPQSIDPDLLESASMKPLFFHISLTLVLASCSPAVAPKPTPIPTATAIPPTAIPPTATIVPSPTVDPNMPEGATGKDGQGQWTKTVAENGKPVTYTWKDLRIDKDREPMVSGWFAPHVLDGVLYGGIPLMEQDPSFPISTKMIPFYFDFQEGVNGPYLRHPKEIEMSRTAPTFTRKLYTELEEQYLGKNILKLSYDQHMFFYARIYINQISIRFSTRTGDFVWRPGTRKGYTFYAVGWESLDPAMHPEFYEDRDASETKLSYRWTIYADSEGNLISVGAVNKDPRIITANQLYDWILHPMEKVLNEYDAPVYYRLSDTGTNSARTLSMVSLYQYVSIPGVVPEFEIVATP